MSLTHASDSHTGNISCLQRLLTISSKNDREIAVSFSLRKTELFYWSTSCQKSRHSKAPISFEGSLFHPLGVIRWFSYWQSPSLNSLHHVSHQLFLANTALSFGKPLLPPPGARVCPFLCHGIAQGLLFPHLL